MEITKQEFWNKIIVCGDNGQHRRFVLKRDLVLVEELAEEGDSYSDIEERIIESQVEATHMFVPVGPNDDFNLVSSLCTDGLHRPVFDIDFPKDQVQLAPPNKMYLTHDGSRSEIRLTGGYHGPMIPIASTNHLHVYTHEPMDHAKYVEKLMQIPGDDAAKYRSNVVRAGYGSLRPPWIKKETKPPTPSAPEGPDYDKLLEMMKAKYPEQFKQEYPPL